MTIDLDAAIRRRKPDKRRKQLAPRPRSELTATADLPSTGSLSLVADTNVYINNAAGRLPADAQVLLDRAILFHCSVCLAEIATGVANGDPTHKNWQITRAVYAGVVSSIPPSRLLTPDPNVWVEAGVVAGTLARTQGFQPYQRTQLLNDALILLTAAKMGLAVLTSDRDHYDLLQQLCPEGQFILY